MTLSLPSTNKQQTEKQNKNKQQKIVPSSLHYAFQRQLKLFFLSER